MQWQAWTTIGIVLGMLAMMALSTVGPDLIMLGGVVILLTCGVIGPHDALAGFANEGMITVGVLFVVAAALKETGGLNWVAQRILGRPQTVAGAQARMMFPVAFMSAFMNNTPLVAMMLPVVDDWAKRCRLSVSKLMIPLSYATILGGCCTLIGTSTNVVVGGLYAQYTKAQGNPQTLGMFDISLVGVCCAVAGLAYLMLFSRWLLPDRKPAIGTADDPREYTVEMMVASDSPLVGQTIEHAGLRHLPNMYLMEIDRDGEVLPAVGHQERLHANDRLIFVGVVDSVVDLQKIRGLVPATEQHFKLDAPRGERCLIEAVVSDTCPLVGRTIREGRFRATYNAAVIAVARNGARLRMKIGDIVLRPGDTLMLEAHESFVDQQRNSRDFYLVSQVEGASLPNHDRAWIAVAILGAMVLAAAMEWLSMLNAALLAAFGMVITRCLTGIQARNSIDWQVLIAIAAAVGVGKALEVSGTAETITNGMLSVANGHPWAALAMIYLVAAVMTELLTNNAAAILIFPFAMATAATLHVNPMPFVIVTMIAASCGFATPLGYATHLMVYGPGGYRFSDFLRIGLPLDFLMGVVAVLVTPLVFPF